MAIPARSVALLLLMLVSLLLGLALAPAGERRSLLLSGLAGLALAGAAAVAPSLPALAAVILLAACLQGLVPGPRPLGQRLRAPGLAAAFLVVGSVVLVSADQDHLARLAVLTMLLAVPAVVGLVPYLQGAHPIESMPASALVWLGFLGPILALSVTVRVGQVVPVADGAIFGGVLVGLGLVNLAWGSVGAWYAEDDRRAWQHSFQADWGLALVGLGIIYPDGGAAAFLVLAWLLLGRLPLALGARRGPAERARLGPMGIAMVLLLAGMPPFAGFPVRLLLLRGTASLYWPLAAVLVPAMLLWIPHSFRLAATLNRLEGRARLVRLALMAISLGLGLYPGPLLRLAGQAVI